MNEPKMSAAAITLPILANVPPNWLQIAMPFPRHFDQIHMKLKFQGKLVRQIWFSKVGMKWNLVVAHLDTFWMKLEWKMKFEMKLARQIWSQKLECNEIGMLGVWITFGYHLDDIRGEIG